MRRESSKVEEEEREARQRQQRRDAVEILLEARERLFAQLTDDILSNRDVILDSSQNDLFSFEFQEIEERYGARIHALNSLLENLEYRRPRFAHKVETFTTTPENLKQELNALVSDHDQWDLVDLNLTPLEDDKLLVVVGFTVDEYTE